MAAGKTFTVKVDTNLMGVAILLKSAACEWVLLFFLLVDAVFSYFVTKFAEYCELQVPCILCSRLDHVFGKVKSDLYRNLLCSNHKYEISSLVSCQIHGKLADAHGMCEECLLSFAMKKESNQETCKFLLGKLGLDGVQNPLFKDFVPGSLGTKSCTCCSRPWRCRPNVQKLFPSRSLGAQVSKPDIPLPSPPRARSLNRREGLKKNGGRFSVSSSPLLLGFSGYDSLSHVGYTEVKITSDSDSDFLFSDDDDVNVLSRDRNDINDEFGNHQSSRFFSKKQFDDLFLFKQTQKSSNSGTNLHDTDADSDSSEKGGYHRHLGSHVGVGYGFGETKFHSDHEKTDPPLLPELIPLDDIPLSSNPMEINSVQPANDNANNFPFSNQSSTYALFESDIPLSQNIGELNSRVSSQQFADASANGDIGHKSVMKIWDPFDSPSTISGPGLGVDQVSKRSIFQNGNIDASKFTGIETSGLASEETGGRDTDWINSKIDADTLLPSTSQDPELQSSNRNSTTNEHVDETQMNISSNSNGFHKRQSSLERSQSYESLDGSCVSDIEGESLVDGLRRQIEHDRKRINRLYKELEEERNASAIAAHEAMAMITKLQEEKAALHMDALQHLRMMEEQSQYDVDALEKANDLLAEKEKEIQDLEAELEFYRLRYPQDELELENTMNQAWDLVGDNITLEATGTSHVQSFEFVDS